MHFLNSLLVVFHTKHQHAENHERGKALKITAASIIVNFSVKLFQVKK